MGNSQVPYPAGTKGFTPVEFRLNLTNMQIRCSLTTSFPCHSGRRQAKPKEQMVTSLERWGGKTPDSWKATSDKGSGGRVWPIIVSVHKGPAGRVCVRAKGTDKKHVCFA